MSDLKHVLLKKRTRSILFLLVLLLPASAGIYLYRLPKYQVYRALKKTFYAQGAPLSIREPLAYLESGEATLKLELILDQLELPGLSNALSGKLSLLEGLTLDSGLHYSMLQEKLDGTLTLSYLYKPYLNASVFAQQDNLYIKAPELLDNYLKIDTYGIPLFPKGLSYIRSCIGSGAPEEENPLDSLTVTRTEDSRYRLDFAQGNPVYLEIGPDGMVNALSYQADSFEFSLDGPRLTLNTVYACPADSRDYRIGLKGTYLPDGADGAPSLELDSIDITEPSSGFHAVLTGTLGLKEFQEIGPAPDGKIYDLFHLSPGEYALLTAKVLKNLLSTELAPYLSYFK